MHAGPYRFDGAFLHRDDIAGLQALYGPPDELVLQEVDLGPAPAGMRLDESNSGFLFDAWGRRLGNQPKVPLDSLPSSSFMFHWMGWFSDRVENYSGVGDWGWMNLDVCLLGASAGALESAAVYQTSPSGEVSRYGEPKVDSFSAWQCPGGNTLRFSLSHYDYYAARPGAWKFAIGVNGGLLTDVQVHMDTAYRPRYDPVPQASLAVTRIGDGVFDLAARFADVAGPDGTGFGHYWRIPGHWVSKHDPRLPGVTHLPLGRNPRVEFGEPGIYEVSAEARKARRYLAEGRGFTAIARGHLAVPLESGVPSLFGGDDQDAFLHVPAVDVSGSGLAAALAQAGADVSGGYVELLLKRTGHGGEQYKLVEARGASVPAKVSASVSASGHLTMSDVAVDDGMRRSMALSPVAGSNPLRFSLGPPAVPVDVPPADQAAEAPRRPPSAASIPEGEAALAAGLAPPARWPLGEAVPVAYVHDYDLGDLTEGEVRERFFLPALKVIESVAGVTFRVVDHDPEDGSFAGILVSQRGHDGYGQRYPRALAALRERFGNPLIEDVARRFEKRFWVFGEADRETGIGEIKSSLVSAYGHEGGYDSGTREEWDRNQWLQAFVKPLVRALGVDLPWHRSRPSVSPYLPGPREIDALRALYGPPAVSVHPTDIFDPLDFGPVAEDAGLSLDTTYLSGRGVAVGLRDGIYLEENGDGRIGIDAWKLGSQGDLYLYFSVLVGAGAKTPDLGADRSENSRALDDHYDFRAYLVDPEGAMRHVNDLNVWRWEYDDQSSSPPLASIDVRGRLKVGNILASSHGTWKVIIAVGEAKFHERELEVAMFHHPAAHLFNEAPEVDISLDTLGAGRFRLTLGAEDAEGDPFLLAWTGPGREPVVTADLTRTWQENLPEPVVLEYREPGIYQVFARAVGGSPEWLTHWHSAYVAVPHRSGEASYFPAERILHVPAVQTDDGIWEWNLRRVGEDDPSDIRFMLLDSKRVEGSGVTAVSTDSQTGLFHLDKLLGFGRGCGTARLGEIPGSEPPRLRLSACKATSNQAPAVPNPIAGQEARVGSRFAFTLPDGTFVDPEGDELAYRYLPPPDAAWLEFDSATRTFSGTPPTTAASKDYAITVAAHDGYDDSARATFTLAVGDPNSAPILANSLANQRLQRARANSPFAFTLPDGIFSDADGDSLTYGHGVNRDSPWLSFNSLTGTFSGTPPVGARRLITITVYARDGYGGQARVYFYLFIDSNREPTVANPRLPSQNARIGSPFAFTLPDGTFADADGDTLSYGHSVSPVAPWLTFDASTATFSGTPPVADSGRDFAVTVTARDGYDGSARATFTLSVMPATGSGGGGNTGTAPTVARPAADQRARAGSPFTFTLPDDTFTDADGDALTYSHSANPDADWLSLDVGTGAFSGTPPAAAAGMDFAITVTARDRHGSQVPDTFTLAVGNPNSAPTVARPVADQSVPAGSPVAFTLPDGAFADADRDALTYAHSASPAAPWLSLDAGTGAFSGTPPATAAGMAFAITVTARDRHGSQVPDTFTLAVGNPNSAPAVANPVADQRALAGSPFEFTLPDGTFADADGDALTYAHSASPAAPWLFLDAGTGSFSGTPPNAAAGMDFAVTVTARDGYDDSAPATFTLSVEPAAGPDTTVTDSGGGGGSTGTEDANAAPTVNFDALPAATAYVGLPFSYQVGGNVFSDGDLDGLSFSATMADGGALPEWLSFDGERGEFRGVPPADDGHAGLYINVTAEDGIDASPPAQFILRVEPSPALATGTIGTDSGNIHLPSVGIQPDGGGFQTCITAYLFTAAGDFSLWEMSHIILPEGCPLPAAEGHRMPVFEGNAGSMALRVPLVEFGQGDGRMCMAMEFAPEGAGFQFLRLAGMAAVECPARIP